MAATSELGLIPAQNVKKRIIKINKEADIKTETNRLRRFDIFKFVAYQRIELLAIIYSSTGVSPFKGK